MYSNTRGVNLFILVVVFSLAISLAGSAGVTPVLQLLRQQRDLRSFANAVDVVFGQGAWQVLGELNCTIFAPTDEAFELAKLNAFLMEPEELYPYVFYHIVSGVIAPTDIRNERRFPTINFMGEATDSMIRANIYSGVTYLDGIAVVNTTRSIIGRNGYLHVIDTVLDPPTDQLYDLSIAGELARNSAFSTLNRMIGAARFSSSVVKLGDSESPVTLFAPTNDAFMKLPPGILRALRLNSKALQHLLTYHIVRGTYYSVGLKTGSLPTIAGIPVVVQSTSTATLVSRVPIIHPDISRTSGVIHVMNSVLRPPDMCLPPVGVATVIGNASFWCTQITTNAIYKQADLNNFLSWISWKSTYFSNVGLTIAKVQTQLCAKGTLGLKAQLIALWMDVAAAHVFTDTPLKELCDETQRKSGGSSDVDNIGQLLGDSEQQLQSPNAKADATWATTISSVLNLQAPGIGTCPMACSDEFDDESTPDSLPPTVTNPPAPAVVASVPIPTFSPTFPPTLVPTSSPVDPVPSPDIFTSSPVDPVPSPDIFTSSPVDPVPSPDIFSPSPVSAPEAVTPSSPDVAPSPVIGLGAIPPTVQGNATTPPAGMIKNDTNIETSTIQPSPVENVTVTETTAPAPQPLSVIPTNSTVTGFEVPPDSSVKSQQSSSSKPEDPASHFVLVQSAVSNLTPTIAGVIVSICLVVGCVILVVVVMWLRKRKQMSMEAEGHHTHNQLKLASDDSEEIELNPIQFMPAGAEEEDSLEIDDNGQFEL